HRKGPLPLLGKPKNETLPPTLRRTRSGQPPDWPDNVEAVAVPNPRLIDHTAAGRRWEPEGGRPRWRLGAPGRSIPSQVDSGRSATHPSRGPRDADRHGLGSPPTGPAGSTGGAMAPQGFPAEGMELTHILVVEDAARARDFYVDVLGAE